MVDLFSELSRDFVPANKQRAQLNIGLKCCQPKITKYLSSTNVTCKQTKYLNFLSIFLNLFVFII